MLRDLEDLRPHEALTPRAELRAPEAGSCCVILKTSAHTKR